MADVFEENPCITFGEAAGECGRRWRVLPEEAKEEFRNMAAADKERYTLELATFKSKAAAGGENDAVVTKPAPRTKAAARRKKPEVEVPEVKRGPEPKRAKSALL